MTKPSAKQDERVFIRRVLIVLALASLVFLLWQLRSVVLMLFGAIVVATVLRALAEPIHRWARLPQGLSLAAAVLIVVAILFAVGWLFGAEISSQFRNLTETLPSAWRGFQDRLEEWGLAEEVRSLGSSLGGDGSLSAISGIAMSLSTGVADTLLVIFGGIFLAAQPRFYRTGAIKLVPRARRKLIAGAMDDSEKALRLWLKAQLVSMLVVGLLTGIGLWLIGVPSALVLGLFSGLLEFIPFAGPIVAAIPGILLALVLSPELALWTLGVYVLVQQVEAYLVYPMVQQWAVHLPPVVLLFSLIAFGMLFGTIGVILAAPLTVVTYVLVKRLYVVEALDTPTEIPGHDEK